MVETLQHDMNLASLQTRIDAYKDADGYIPSLWTPEHVGARMVEAFETLAKVPERVSPAVPRAFWPPVASDYPCARSAVRIRATSQELSRMEEAFCWPITFLGQQALMSDALLLWAHCEATGKSVAGVLRQRMAQARILAGKMTQDENTKRATMRRTLAGNIAAWANQRMSTAQTADQKERIRANAAIRFERAVQEKHCLPIEYSPRDAVTDMILTRKSLDKWRHRAMAEIADRLHERRVAVR